MTTVGAQGGRQLPGLLQELPVRAKSKHDAALLCLLTYPRRKTGGSSCSSSSTTQQEVVVVSSSSSNGSRCGMLNRSRTPQRCDKGHAAASEGERQSAAGGGGSSSRSGLYVLHAL